MAQAQGITRGLTNYGDQGFAAYLRRSFIKSMGYTDESLAKPIVGIAFKYAASDGPIVPRHKKQGVVC